MASSPELGNIPDLRQEFRTTTRRQLLKTGSIAVAGLGIAAKGMYGMTRLPNLSKIHVQVEKEMDEKFPLTAQGSPDRTNTINQLQALQEKAASALQAGDEETISTVFDSDEFNRAVREDFMYQAQSANRQKESVKREKELVEPIQVPAARAFLGFPAYAIGAGTALFSGSAFLQQWGKNRRNNRRMQKNTERAASVIVKNGKETDQSRNAIEKGILLLPPTGGKIHIVVREALEKNPMKMIPRMTAEEQVEEVRTLRREGKLGEGYVHQLTVQGRLPDEFKYTALALIMGSPYAHNWDEPFFEAPWGKVAPLVHDGGNVDVSVNPFWGVTRRTDFLYRKAKVIEPDLEKLKSMTAKQLYTLGVDKLANARYEELEDARLETETKAYQRLALALHAKLGSLPKGVPQGLKDNLARHWEVFKTDMNLLFAQYHLQDVTQVLWFTPTARQLPHWPGLRYEAEWNPIQASLKKIEEVRVNNPELISSAKGVLQNASAAVDKELGLRQAA